MGRKQKLRAEKKKQQPPSLLTSSSTSRAKSRAKAKAGCKFEDQDLSVKKNIIGGIMDAAVTKDEIFPKSAVCVEADQVLKDQNTFSLAGEDITAASLDALFQQASLGRSTPNDTSHTIGLYYRGAIEYGCVPSMHMYGRQYFATHPNSTHRVLPFYLEAAIRGHMNCMMSLIGDNFYQKAQPHPPEALISYWLKMINKYMLDGGSHSLNNKKFTTQVTRACIMCHKMDSNTFTLRQCMGCSMYCYCGEDCQIKHWTGQSDSVGDGDAHKHTHQYRYKHKGECKQLAILNKYHKPYAKEIFEAVIRGEVENIPHLEKLRAKLGLSRPVADYAELLHDATLLTPPMVSFVARDDGTVWVGSVPHPMGGVPPPVSPTTPSNTNTDEDVEVDVEVEVEVEVEVDDEVNNNKNNVRKKEEENNE